MLETSFLIQDGACLFEKQALYWWCQGDWSCGGFSFFLTLCPLPTWYGDGFIFSMGRFYEGQGTPQMILRGEPESMSKKMKEKRNEFGENGMQSLGGLTPDLASGLRSVQGLGSNSSSQDVVVFLLLKMKLYWRKASSISSEANASQ